MARSRYARTPVSGNMVTTFVDPTRVDWLHGDITEGLQVVDHVMSHGERLDALAARYYGDEGYWWVIALVNRIGFALGIPAGRIIKVPLDVGAVLAKVQR